MRLRGATTFSLATLKVLQTVISAEYRGVLSLASWTESHEIRIYLSIEPMAADFVDGRLRFRQQIWPM